MKIVSFLVKWARIYWFRFLKRFCLQHKRNPHLWVFGARDRDWYDENTKYFFEFVHKHMADIHAVWITRNRTVYGHLKKLGYDVRLSHSLSGYFAQYHAGVSFINVSYRDVSWFLLYGSPIVQLWHGTPMMDNDIGALGEHYSFVTVAAEEFLSEQRLGDPEKFDFKLTGYPRADSLFHSDEAPCIHKLRERYSFEKIILYVPTHRSHPHPDDGCENMACDLFKPYGFDFEICEDLLRRHKALFLMKLHPLQVHGAQKLAKLFEQSEYMHLVELHPTVDVFEYMRSTDVLITDFSSILFDYLLLDRPVLFTPFDIEYMRTFRSFRFDYEATIPGPQAMDWSSAMQLLDGIMSGSDEYSRQRRTLCRRFNYYRDNKSAKRVAEESRKLLGMK